MRVRERIIRAMLAVVTVGLVAAGAHSQELIAGPLQGVGLGNFDCNVTNITPFPLTVYVSQRDDTGAQVVPPTPLYLDPYASDTLYGPITKLNEVRTCSFVANTDPNDVRASACAGNTPLVLGLIPCLGTAEAR